MLYGIGTACVLTWRGTWLLWDESGHFMADLLKSSWNKADSKSLSLPQSKQETHHDNATTTQLQDHHHHGESTLTDHPDIDEPVLFYSGIVSHVFATVGLLYIGRFTSIMAPPANITIVLDTFIHGKGRNFYQAVKAFTQLKR
jgi:hypothetical protein